MTPQEFLQHLRRRWWWSEEPYWKYLDRNGQGWANAVDVHPGLFNLIWLHAGVRSVPANFSHHVASAAWALNRGQAIKCDGVPLADLAFNLSLRDFTSRERACKLKLPRAAQEKT